MRKATVLALVCTVLLTGCGSMTEEELGDAAKVFFSKIKEKAATDTPENEVLNIDNVGVKVEDFSEDENVTVETVEVDEISKKIDNSWENYSSLTINGKELDFKSLSVDEVCSAGIDLEWNAEDEVYTGTTGNCNVFLRTRDDTKDGKVYSIIVDNRTGEQMSATFEYRGVSHLADKESITEAVGSECNDFSNEVITNWNWEISDETRDHQISYSILKIDDVIKEVEFSLWDVEMMG